jgi:carbamoyl-phosphate synthase small subunit
VPAILALADGSIFSGFSIGATGHTSGEVVFNTAMTGYQEILTDPSYSRQIVTLTYPHIGNTGVNPEDVESNKVHAAGLIIRDLPLQVSNFRATQSLSDYLKAENIVAIAGIDTRKLTRLLREKGAQSGAIVAGAGVTPEQALQHARAFTGLAGLDLAKVVSTTKSYEWTQTEWKLGEGYGQLTQPKFHVVAFDYGVKFNILRMLADRGCKVTVLPAQSTAKEALALKPDGIFLSNGPGDPQPCDYAIAAARELIEDGMPTFGICLGHQIMALASGARTIILCKTSIPSKFISLHKIMVLQSIKPHCQRIVVSRMCRCLMVLYKVLHARINRLFVFKGIRKHHRAHTILHLCSIALSR